ncbi:uncharacterized protein LOC116344698 [Contarinia nasturtii]|uniref:uncharacterized protein LOC116344698 n=1 Tax=Contarinia nasturtii TaxID=265458 RepID=UPI0012D49DB8|nr:uncharacterized protein LOC116344698 [Contarinia nasturtii]
MEQHAQHKIEVLSKRRCSPKLPPYMDWSNAMVNQQHHRQTFHLVRRMRKRHFYPQRWKTFIANDSILNKTNGIKSNCGNGSYAILCELDRINRQIHTLQSEIAVLKQQLRIIQTYCVPMEKTESNDQSASVQVEMNVSKPEIIVVKDIIDHKSIEL